MIMKKRSSSIAVLATLIILLAGCYPQGPEYVEDLDVVLTNFQDEYDFDESQTYALPDRIVKITGNLVEGDDPEFMPTVTADFILAQIDKNMSELGWEKVGIDENPDVLVTPASWESTTIVYYYDYWYWWYGGYYPGWGYYYPSISAYTTGTLLMNMIDPEVVGANGNPVVQWTGAINGLLTWSYDANRVNSAIDRAFDQSPYLKTN
jgi:predicted small lipoprotein YifL